MAKKATRNKNIIIGLILLALIAVGGALYVKDHQKASNQASANYNPQTKTTTNGSSGSSGGVVSTQPGSGGAGSAASAAGQKAASASGVITLSSPTAGQTVTNGTTVSGTASGLSQVQYRIKDTVRGVIASGLLPVSNGAFSGTVTGLQPASSSGTFEVFDYNSGSGAEENGIKINVNFSQ